MLSDTDSDEECQSPATRAARRIYGVAKSKNISFKRPSVSCTSVEHNNSPKVSSLQVASCPEPCCKADALVINNYDVGDTHILSTSNGAAESKIKDLQWQLEQLHNQMDFVLEILRRQKQDTHHLLQKANEPTPSKSTELPAVSEKNVDLQTVAQPAPVIKVVETGSNQATNYQSFECRKQFEWPVLLFAAVGVILAILLIVHFLLNFVIDRVVNVLKSSQSAPEYGVLRKNQSF